MAITRLQRRVKRRRIKSIEAADYLKKITFVPVVKKIDIGEIKKNFINNKNNESRQKATIVSLNSEENVKKSKNDTNKVDDEKAKNSINKNDYKVKNNTSKNDDMMKNNANNNELKIHNKTIKSKDSDKDKDSNNSKKMINDSKDQKTTKTINSSKKDSKGHSTSKTSTIKK